MSGALTKVLSRWRVCVWGGVPGVIMLKTIHDELETFWVGSLHNHSFDNHCENECFRHAFARMFVCLGSWGGGGGGHISLPRP